MVQKHCFELGNRPSSDLLGEGTLRKVPGARCLAQGTWRKVKNDIPRGVLFFREPKNHLFDHLNL